MMPSDRDTNGSQVIYVELAGGLGNQMFQYAVGRALADRTGADLTLDTRLVDRDPKRRFALAHFRVRARWTSSRWQLRDSPIHRLGLLACPVEIVEPWPPGGLDPRLLTAGPHTRLRGYWQAFSYFGHQTDRLREELTPRRLSPRAMQFAAALAAQPNIVGVHVRRGDYVTDPTTNAFHGTLPPSYYRTALGHVLKRDSVRATWVFSDDPAWCREHLDGVAPEMHVISGHGLSDIDELWLLAQCRHRVIANSSFSWWSATLGTNDGVVVAPRRWFADPSAVGPELPRQWITC